MIQNEAWRESTWKGLPQGFHKLRTNDILPSLTAIVNHNNDLPFSLPFQNTVSHFGLSLSPNKLPFSSLYRLYSAHPIFF
jgi:hypothetical protein